MLPDLLYISQDDASRLAPSPAAMRRCMAEVFQDLASGACIALPKAQLDIGPGASFQTMVAASYRWKMAAVKWIGVVPVGSEARLPGISAVICLNDLATGHPLALLDGALITLLRTAAISALAAERLIAGPPKVLAFAGCGAQAESHLYALHALFPSLRHVKCLSRSRASASRLARLAEGRGLMAEVVTDASGLLHHADIVISSIPAASGLRPFLDASHMKPDALAIMVDLGRSWIAASMKKFALIATDCMQQMVHPVGADGNPVDAVRITQDLRSAFATGHGRRAFCFKGHAAGDLGAAKLLYDLAQEQAIGTVLSKRAWSG